MDAGPALCLGDGPHPGSAGLPIRSLDQALFVLALFLALVSFWAWGRTLARRAFGITSLAPVTAVYLGQFTLLAVAAPISVLNGLVATLIGRALPLVGWVVPLTALVLVAEVRAASRTCWERPVPRLGPFTLIGLACGAWVMAAYSNHIASLGLDVHEHTFWVQQILLRGRVSLSEEGTHILSWYPRTFHLLGALWTAAGLAPPPGPFVKAMPFLQNALPVLASGEMLVRVLTRGNPGVAQNLRGCSRDRGVRLRHAYRTDGLPRSAALRHAAILEQRHSAFARGAEAYRPRVPRVTRRVGLAGLPAAAGCLGADLERDRRSAVLAVVTVPTLAACWIALPPASGWLPPRGIAAAFGVSVFLSALVAAQDPWLAWQATKRVPAYAALLKVGGLMPYDQAVKQGRASDREYWTKPDVSSPPCADTHCVLLAATKAARRAVALPLRDARSAGKDLGKLARNPSLDAARTALAQALPITHAQVGPYAALPYFIAVAAGAMVASWRAVRRRHAGYPALEALSRLLIASVAALVVAGVALAFVENLATALDDHTHDGWLLAVYLSTAGAHVSLAWLWLPLGTAAAILVKPLVVTSSRVSSRVALGSLPERTLLAVASLALWLPLPWYSRPSNLAAAAASPGYWGPIRWRDVAALRRVEATIPREDGVIVPAIHETINLENWVVSKGDTTALLAYGDRRYIFNFYLGASYPVSWRDLAGHFCSADSAVRARFLARTATRWVLVRDPSARDSIEAAALQQVCGQSLTAFGVELPAARADGRIYLYRLSR